ncbi:hypothetical protein IKF63_01720 [Candidatus Saccharibacteria bacterium]|nr:hypothetical protein [Candidatus Saccharibacteria bacterium]
MRKCLLSLLLLIAFTLFFVQNTFANSKVHFEGGANNFVFYSDSDWADTDLFGGLKNTMPGDVRTENITIKNIADDYDYVKIYLRAEPTTEEIKDFLAHFTLNIYKDNELISSTSAAEQGSLETNVLLGTFANGDEVLLTTELLAPLTLENKYMYVSGEIQWVFTAEAYKDGKIIPPDTGTITNSNEYSTGTIVGVCLTATVLVIAYASYLFQSKKTD